MSKKISVLLIALTLLLGFTYTAKAEVQNVKVGGDILVQGIWEKDVDLYDEKDTPKVNDFIYQVTRVYVSADLTDNVNAYVRFVNDRVWGARELSEQDLYIDSYDYYRSDYWANNDSDVSFTKNLLGTNVELDLAYVTFAEMFGYPVSLTIGRQELKYGEGFLIGDGYNDIYWIYGLDEESKWKTAAYIYGPRKAFDAIKFSGKYDNSTVDVIKAKITEGYGIGNDVDLYGVNWNLNAGDYGIYDFGLFYQKYNADDPTISGKNETTALAIRGEGTIPWVTVGSLKAKAEVVKEWGKVDSSRSGTGEEENLNAWGGYAGLNYTFDNPYEPYIGITYTRLTGDKKTTDEREGFNPLYQDEKYGEIADAILYGGRATNAKITQLGLGVSPNEKLNLGLDYYIFETDQAAGSPYYIKGESDSRKLGTEWDLAVTYDYTEDVQFGLTYAVFTPGKQIKDYNDYYNSKDAQARVLVGSVKVTF